MLMPEFESRYNQLVKAIEGPLTKPDKIESNNERMKLFYHRFKNNTLDRVVEAIERAAENTDYFPKLAEVKKELDNIYKENNAKSLSKDQLDQYDWYTFLMNTNPENAKYYGEKIDGWQKENVLKRMKEKGIQGFEPIDSNPGFKKFKQFMIDLESGKIGNNFGQLSRIDPGLCREAKKDARTFDIDGYKINYDESPLTQEEELIIDDIEKYKL
jgi:hypothetical protein